MKVNSPLWNRTLASFKRHPKKYPKKELTKPVLEELLIDRHLTYAEVGKRFNKTRARICQLVKDYGIDTTNLRSFPTTCPYCKTVFEISRSDYKHLALRYCHQSCYQAHKESKGRKGDINGTQLL